MVQNFSRHVHARYLILLKSYFCRAYKRHSQIYWNPKIRMSEDAEIGEAANPQIRGFEEMKRTITRSRKSSVILKERYSSSVFRNDTRYQTISERQNMNEVLYLILLSLRSPAIDFTNTPLQLKEGVLVLLSENGSHFSYSLELNTQL